MASLPYCPWILDADEKKRKVKQEWCRGRLVDISNLLRKRSIFIPIWDDFVIICPVSLGAFCWKTMETMVCARELVAFIFVAATVRLCVPSEITASISPYVSTPFWIMWLTPLFPMFAKVCIHRTPKFGCYLTWHCTITNFNILKQKIRYLIQN